MSIIGFWGWVVGVRGRAAGGDRARWRRAGALLLTGAAVLACSAPPALAAAPETPVNEKVKNVTATTATLEGELNPAKAGEAGEYDFDFRVSGSECVGEGVAPEPAGIAVGFKEEKVEVKLTGLQPDAKYTFCLFERNAASEEAGGVPVTFETKVAAPTVESESFSSVKANGARLEGVVNPNNQVSECKFQYGTEPSLATGTTTTLCEPGSFPAEYGGQGVALNVGGLEEHKTYYYRVLATNMTGTQTGTIGHFETAVKPETPEEVEPASAITATEATLHGSLNPAAPGNPGAYEFRYRQSPSECQGGNPGEEKATPSTAAAGGKKEAAEATVTGLLPGRQYTFCLLATNEAGETSSPSPPVTFTTLGQAPRVEGESSSEVSLTGAQVSAQVDPGGLASTYRVEYGTGGTYASSTPATSLGDAPVDISVAAHLSGLEPGTLYQYRFVVSNALGTVTDSENATFTTSAAAPAPEASSCPNEASRKGPSAALPDCRAYEQVTPVDKGGAEDIFPTGGGVEGAGAGSIGETSEDGDQYLLDTDATLGEGGGGGGKNSYVFSRGPGGWATASAVAPGLGVQSLVPELFDPADLSNIGVLAYVGSQGAETDEERAHDYLVGPAGGPYATVDHKAGEQETAEMVGGSADLSHVVLATEHQQLAPGDSSQDPGSKALYEWVGGRYSLVNVNTSGSLVSLCGAVLGEGFGDGGSYRAVSSDGSKIFFTAPDPYVGQYGGRETGCWGGKEEWGGTTESGTRLVDPPQLYMRLDGTSTVDVSAPAPDAKESTPYPALYVGASADGEKVFFLSEGELTADATGHSIELYEYDTLTSTLTRVSRGDSGTVEGKVAAVPSISSDGSAVYFTAEGQLAPGAPEGQVNLYRYDTNSGVTTYIAGPISEGDYESDHIGYWYAQMWYTGNAQVRALFPKANWYATANGQYLAFVSGQNLTGEGKGKEVYLYSAASNTLVCASCDATGAGQVSDAEFARSAYQAPSDTSPRPVSEDGGYVFFDASDVLVPGALAGVLHVYEWHDGKISLISAGGDPSDSFFVGSSADGSNVFIGTHSQLVAQDADQAADLYDARIDGGFEGLAPPACTGTGCQGVPEAPPIFATPASVTFAGIGNFLSEPPPKKTVTKKATKCKKGFSAKKGKCVKNKKSKKAKKSAKKSARKSAHINRRASR